MAAAVRRDFGSGAAPPSARSPPSLKTWTVAGETEIMAGIVPSCNLYSSNQCVAAVRRADPPRSTRFQTIRAFSISRLTRYALVLASLRQATISTRSPVLYSLFSSCAWYLRDLRDELAVERVLDAALDQHRDRLVHLVADDAPGQRLDDRLPRRRGLRPARPSVSVRSCLPLSAGLLVDQRPRAGDVAPHLLQLLGVGELLRRPLHPQAELLLEQRGELRLELVPATWRRAPSCSRFASS